MPQMSFHCALDVKIHSFSTRITINVYSLFDKNFLNLKISLILKLSIKKISISTDSQSSIIKWANLSLILSAPFDISFNVLNHVTRLDIVK